MLIMIPAYPHCTYKISNRLQEVIYVGVTSGIFTRLGQHQRDKPWWVEVESIDIDSFADRESADDHEKRLIQALRPRYNTVFNAERQAQALMTEAGVSPDDVRAFLRARDAHRRPEAVGVSLRDFAQARGIDLGKLKEWRRAHTSTFPEPTATGDNRTALYDSEALDFFVISRGVDAS